MPPPSNASPDVLNTNVWVRRQLAQNAHHLTKSEAPADPLETAITAWWNSLPAVTRNRKYALTEISDALHSRSGRRFADRHITAILESVGWTTGRSWTRAGRNRRFWTPPSSNQTKE